MTEQPAKPVDTIRMAGVLGFPLTKNDRALADLKKRHKGRTIFVLGNGPSVQITDLDRLTGAVCIALNRFYLAYSRTQLRPTYTVCAGTPLLEDHGADILNAAGTPVLAPLDDLVQMRDPKSLDGILAFHRRPDDTPTFEPNVFKGFGRCGDDAVFPALQLAAWMGAARIVIYGADQSYTVADEAEREGELVRDAGERNHFIAGYRQKGQYWRPPDESQINAAMAEARVWSDRNKAPIVNATRGGRLEAFERTEFDSEVEEARPEVASYLSV